MYKFFLAFRGVSVPPSALLIAPLDAAVFAYKERLAVVFLTVPECNIYAVFEFFGKGFGILVILVYVEYVCVYMEISACVYDRTGIVHSLCHVVDNFNYPVVLSFAVYIPGFIERAPSYDRGMRIISFHRFYPLRKKSRERLKIIGFYSPVAVLAPDKISEAVRPVKKTRFKYFLMQPCAVEAQTHGILYIRLQSIIARSSVDPIGIESLIKDPPAEDALAVYKKFSVSEGYLAKSEIRAYAVSFDSVVFITDTEVVKSAASRFPKMLFRKRNADFTAHTANHSFGASHISSLVICGGLYNPSYCIF